MAEIGTVLNNQKLEVTGDAPVARRVRIPGARMVDPSDVVYWTPTGCISAALIERSTPMRSWVVGTGLMVVSCLSKPPFPLFPSYFISSVSFFPMLPLRMLSGLSQNQHNIGVYGKGS